MLRNAEREREQLRAELAQSRVTPPERPRLMNVRDLVPSHCAADPNAPTAGKVRLAFRSHVLFRNAARCSLDWPDLVRLDCDTDTRRALLCEFYSRAIFECSIAAHFDGAELRTDYIVLENIADAFGARVAFEVHTAVEREGYVRAPFPFADRVPPQLPG